MRTRTVPFRLTAAAAAWTMLAACVEAGAQTQPFGGPAGVSGAPTQPFTPSQSSAPTQPFANPGDENVTPAQDPPATVGRVAKLRGTVSYHGADQAQWEAATPNFPVTSGASFWTEPESGAEIEAAGTRFTLDQQTQLSFDQIADQQITATLAQGVVAADVAALAPGETITLRTPRGDVAIAAPGRYEVAAGDTGTPTTVSVVSGQARVSGDGVSLAVGAGQVATISGSGPFTGSVAQMAAPPALVAQAAPPPAPPASTVPPVVAQMTGGTALYGVGEWSTDAEYGQVWYPPVEADYVPYRSGHWAFVPPWGWTWVDDAPWGFAPFHYGRWVHIGPRWGWVPVLPGVAVVSRPVYAPALVAFVGLAAGVAVGVGIGRTVGWCPLGPREVYVPPFRHSQAYLRNVNAMYVPNAALGRRPGGFPGPGNFVNRAAATMVPAAAMAGSQRIAPLARPVPGNAQFRPMQGGPGVRPTTATAGVTPGLARRMNLSPPVPGSAAPRPAAPGPQFRPQAAGAPVPLRAPGGGRAPGGAGPVALPGAGVRPGGATPAPAAPQPRVIQPGAAQPGPVQPGAVQPRPQGQPFGGQPRAAAPPAVQRPAPAPQPGPAQPGAVQPRPAAPRPQPQVQPQPRMQPQVPRPAPQMQAPQMQAPRAQPQFQAPRPQPQFQAPRPAPAPQPRAAPPAPRPAPQPAPRPQPQPAPQHRACPPGRTC